MRPLSILGPSGWRQEITLLSRRKSKSHCELVPLHQRVLIGTLPFTTPSVRYLLGTFFASLILTMSLKLKSLVPVLTVGQQTSSSCNHLVILRTAFHTSLSHLTSSYRILLSVIILRKRYRAPMVLILSCSSAIPDKSNTSCQGTWIPTLMTSTTIIYN